MFVVAGVTGNTGSAAARTLLARGRRVRGIARDPSRARAPDGVELVGGALDDAAAMTRAFEGAEGAYVLCPPDIGHPDPIGLYVAVATAAAEAARTNRLKRLVLLSSEGAHLSAGTGPVRGLYEAERVLADAAPEPVFLRPTFFMENWRNVVTPAREQGVLPTFLADPTKPRSMVATWDIGRVAAELLLEDAPPRVVELSGPEDYSVSDVAAVLAELLRRPVEPVHPPREAWVGILRENGLGPAYAELLAEMYGSLNDGRMRFEGVDDHRRGRVTIREVAAGWV